MEKVAIQRTVSTSSFAANGFTPTLVVSSLMKKYATTPTLPDTTQDLASAAHKPLLLFNTKRFSPRLNKEVARPAIMLARRFEVAANSATNTTKSIAAAISEEAHRRRRAK